MGLLADVTEVVQAFDPTQLDGCHLDEPRVGTQIEPGALRVSGWVLARDSPVVAVEVNVGDVTVARAGSFHPRPDVAAVFPAHPGADRPGFQLTVAGVWEDTIRLKVQAVLAGQSRCQIGTITVGGGAQEKSSPKVSVVIPCYGQAHFLASAINSALAQTYANVEVVVVDDGSRDNAAAVAARYPGVRCVRQKNGGVSEARNAGIRASSGEFLVFLDADDMLLPHAVQVGMDCLKGQAHGQLATGTYRYVDGIGRSMPTPPQPNASEDYYAALLRANYLGTPGTTIFRRLVLDEVGGFDQRFSPAEDYELGLRIARRGHPIHCHDVAVLEYRRASNHASDDSRLMMERTFRALRFQRQNGFGSDHLRAAYSEALEAWRRCYRPDVVDQTCESIERRDRRGALRAMLTFLRYDRRGLRDVVRHSRDRRAASRLTG